MKDIVKVRDQLLLSTEQGKVICPAVEEHEPVQVRGFFSLVCRERGKIVPGTKREGLNIWTLTGREYLARLMSYSAYGISPAPDTPNRNDRIRYIGMGTGTTPEVSSVARLVTPLSYDLSGGGLFLAPLAIPTYPFQTVSSFGTAVRYTREFAETELSTATSVVLTEAGLFTDGDPGSSFAPLTRNTSIALAGSQAPAAYKSFEPLKKTQNFVLQLAWEIRF